MQWTDEKDMSVFCEVIGEGVFNHKSGIHECGTSWQKVATTLNAIYGFLLTARAFRDTVTNLFKKFSDQNNSEKKSIRRRRSRTY